MQSAAPFVLRPVLAFRIGVTGVRAIEDSAIAPLRQQIAAVLGLVKEQVEKLGAGPRAAALYAPVPARLRLLSPLAEGADRLVAEEALALGYELEVPMPFAQAEYEKDFPESVTDFRALLGRAGGGLLALDGARGEDEARSYEAVGRLVARNCDLLIAIWDGGKGRGRGGTAEIVRFAAHREQSVWWLRSDGAAQPRWIENLQELRRPETCLGGEAARARLEVYLARTILPAPEPQEPPPGVIGAIFHRLQRRHPPAPPLAAFLAEKPQPRRAIWTIHRHVLRWAAGGQKDAPPSACATAPPAGEVWPYWQGFFMPADRLAVDYGDRYRSSYMMVFAFAALALSCAVFGVGVHAEARAVTPFELVFLSGIFVVVGLNQSRRWHGRLIAYRLLAELFRKQQALALLGWSLPPAVALHISGDANDQTAPLPRDAMIGWYFNAALRAAPLPQGHLAGPLLAATYRAVEASLIAGQRDYHASRRRDAEAAARRFGQLGSGLFLGTLAIVLVKCVVLWTQYFWRRLDNAYMDDGAICAGLIAVLLPALSAAFVGIRSYAELELLADQSAQMQRLLARAEQRLRALALDAPLASQELAAEILLLAEGMLLDIKGWAQLFRVKAVEAG
jgi:hypothetical protein